MVSTSRYELYFLGTEFQVCSPFAFYPVSCKTLLFGSLKFEGYERQSLVTLDWIKQTQIGKKILNKRNKIHFKKF
jgi:hypothetical protein